jgi:hypothetical protein
LDEDECVADVGGGGNTARSLVCDPTVGMNGDVAGRVAWVAVHRCAACPLRCPRTVGPEGCCERGGAWMLQHNFLISCGGPDGRLRECCPGGACVTTVVDPSGALLAGRGPADLPGAGLRRGPAGLVASARPRKGSAASTMR